MAKKFNTTAVCIPEEHYMVNIDKRLEDIKKLVDEQKYFTINRARQYGKTTTLIALEQYLKKEYYVVSMDFQTFGSAEFKDENTFALSFAETFVHLMNEMEITNEALGDAIGKLELQIDVTNTRFSLKSLFGNLSTICKVSDKPILLLIDEVDSAANNQVFLDFLAQLRAYYIKRKIRSTFYSVILAGVYDIKNLRIKIRLEEEHKVNSP